MRRVTSVRLNPVLYCLALALLLFVAPALAQDPIRTPLVVNETESSWTPPDVMALPADWWKQFDMSSPEVFQKRAKRFTTVASEKIKGLEGDELVTGQNLLSSLSGQFELLIVAIKGPETESFEPIPTKDAYSLDKLLSLRAQGRDLEKRQMLPQLRIDELGRQSALLEQRRDNLLGQYKASDINAPSRILLGLQRVSARIKYELTKKQLEQQQKRYQEYQQQNQLMSQQLVFARTHLVRGDTDWHTIEGQAVEARSQVDDLSKKMYSVQQQLLDALSADVFKPSLALLRTQQLTRTSADLSLATVLEKLYQAKANWYRFHSGALDFNFNIRLSAKETDALVKETKDQIGVWTSASQTTLISPAPDSGLNAIKNVELAHAVAQETLSLIEDIKAASDDLLQVQEVLTVDMVNIQHGFRGVWTRITIFTGDVREVLVRYLGFTLFHIGDRPVTPGGIIMMMLILAFGFALSWFIRHIIDRLKKRQQFADSPAVYTLSRILHYIIILVALFAAFGSMGLDFTNFALIAGALSVGIGFGLQSIVNNFVSGLVVLFEGSVRVGDYIQLDTDLRGIVKEINSRATIINTNDNIDVVVPNSDFVTNRLTNWTLREPMARFRINFGVAYGSDKETVRKATLEAASEVDFILHKMPGREPQVRLVDFGDSSLEFQLLAWVSKAGVRRPERVRAEFLWALETRLVENGIEIPFPQRDLHLRSGFGAHESRLPDTEPSFEFEPEPSENEQ